MRLIRMLLGMLLCAIYTSNLRADPVDDYIKAEMAAQNVPGLALVVMKRGTPLRVQSYGYANLEHTVPVHPDTLFKTGAVGMQFTAAAVMLLVEDGKLRLDDSVRKYLTEAPKSWQPITIRQMLNHTSGLPATPNGDFRAEYTDDELLGIIYKEELNFSAGARWRFSYVDYLALGMIIKRVTGEYYADLLAKRLFTPLGMRTARPISDLDVIANRAAGYEFHKGALRNAEWISQVANSTADGSLYLSPLDYVAWGAAMAGHALLKPESWQAIAQPARLASGQTYPYGFGWYLAHSAGQDVWHHTGSWQGFKTSIIRYLGDELTIVVLANGDQGNPAMICRQVAAMLYPQLAQSPGTPIEDREPQRAARVRSLLLQIAGDKAAYDDFTQYSRLDFTEMTAGYRDVLGPLGSLQDLALLSLQTKGDDRVYYYRARFTAGFADVLVGVAPNGKIGNLDISAVDGWRSALLD